MAPFNKMIRVAAVVPCFKANLKTLERIVKELIEVVDFVVVIDDACPNFAGNYIDSQFSSDDVRVIWNQENLGVGGATKKGYEYVLSQLNCEVVVKLDCDGQMMPEEVQRLVNPLLSGESDVVKANRYYDFEQILKIPKVRLIGNLILSFFAKASTGYWEIFDPNNGFFAITTAALKKLPLHKISNDYFFESDFLFRSGLEQFIIQEVKIPPIYKGEESALNPLQEIPKFFKKHLINIFKRCFYQYFLFDFNPGSLALLLSVCFMSFSFLWAIILIVKGYSTGSYAGSGDVSLFIISTMVGMQFLIAFINYDTSQRIIIRKSLTAIKSWPKRANTNT